MRLAILALVAACTSYTSVIAQTPIATEQIDEILLSYKPNKSVYAKPSVEKAEVDESGRTVNITFNDATAYIPLTRAQIEGLKEQIRQALPEQYAKYKIAMTATGRDFEALAIDAPRVVVAPQEKKPFVTHIDAEPAPKGLDDVNIALWQSHGRYFNQDLNDWSWQRPRLYQTCEDLFTQSFVMPFLMPMLENAGAYVMSPRERDVSTLEYIIDNDTAASGYAETDGKQSWSMAPNVGFAYNGAKLLTGQNPFAAGTARMVSATKNKKDAAAVASWDTEIAQPGNYAVYVSYQTLPNSATDAVYTINAADGPHDVRVNQKMGGGTWIYLGHYPFNAGKGDKPRVTLSNRSNDSKSVITADAVKIGGGMGNVARTPLTPKDPTVNYTPKTSGYPRFTEGSRYWLQWAGAPDSVYTPKNNTNDYTDDYSSRGYWVNWLTGGSSVLPDQPGLNIPIDLSFAFHSDAGITSDDRIIGTLGIYYTNNRDTYANGTSRLAARDLTNSVMTNIVEDVRATCEPDWIRRGMWDKNYAEARVPEVPTMLLELLSHQNFADMKYGLDPTFRFVVSRGIYKGMLKYIAQRDRRPYVVQPLPVRNMALLGGEDGNYRLSWTERVDSLEPSAIPTYYIIEERIGDNAGFSRLAKVDSTYFDITVTDSDIHSYRVIAGNDGGWSFPSEVLALCYKPGAPQVMVVNGFTRVSGPDVIDTETVRGFVDERDPGVPYIQDISFVGSQYESRSDIPWATNEIAGTGASRSDFEDKVIAGNTFDYVALHGEAISHAGYGFISSSVEAFIENGTSAPVVDLILGNQKEIITGTGRYGSKFKTFSAPLQSRLRAYTSAGGNLCVSGSYLATDLWNNPFSTDSVKEADCAFAKSVLGCSWRSGNATKIPQIQGVASKYKMFDTLEFSFYNDRNTQRYGAVAPDAISPSADGCCPILKYVHTDFTAGTAYASPTHRAVTIGVPFETIISKDSRNQLMNDILKFLTK